MILLSYFSEKVQQPLIMQHNVYHFVIFPLFERKKSNEPYGQTLVYQTFYNPKCHTVDEDILFQTQYLLCCVSEYFDYASKVSIICFIEDLKLLTDRWKINAILWDQVSLQCSMRCHTSATSAVFVLSVSVLVEIEIK